MEQYGDALVCVRYRYDAKTRKQYKTVEIIVSESAWTPPPAKYPDGTLVPLKIGISETVLQGQVRAVGGRWDKQQKVWLVPYGCIAGTKLECRNQDARHNGLKFINVETCLAYRCINKLIDI